MQTNRSCLTSIQTSIMLFLVACLCIFGMYHTVSHAASLDDELSFKLNADGTGYTVSDRASSASGALTIPATYNGLPVTEIGDHAFSHCSELTSVALPLA